MIVAKCLEINWSSVCMYIFIVDHLELFLETDGC